MSGILRLAAGSRTCSKSDASAGPKSCTRSTIRLGNGWRLVRSVLTDMRLLALMFAATLLASPAGAQQTSAPPSADSPAPAQDEGKLPVSLSKIREALE